MVPFDNVLTAIWGLVAFGGFVSTLLLTKAEDYRQRLRFSHQHSRSVFRPDASALVTQGRVKVVIRAWGCGLCR
jgi:hypothetical protein